MSARVRAILLDIEGTTTPIAFVTQVLFPYARTHVREYLERHAASDELRHLLAQLHDDHATDLQGGESVPSWVDKPITAHVASVARYVEWLMDRDRKSTALKELQGRIWEEGYRNGELVGEVFPDVPRALERWHARGLSIAIFSSGSVTAQQLLFRHSTAGDLTRWVHAYFDTRIGPKTGAASYRAIAAELGRPSEAVLFLSDVTRELDAAREAGMQTRLIDRPGNTRTSAPHDYETLRSFDDLPV